MFGSSRLLSGNQEQTYRLTRPGDIDYSPEAMITHPTLAYPFLPPHTNNTYRSQQHVLWASSARETPLSSSLNAKIGHVTGPGRGTKALAAAQAGS